MKLAEAADVRDALNGLDVVETPDDQDDEGDAVERDADSDFWLARVVQPGYLNGEPHYEVVLNPDPGVGSVHIPRELLDWVASADYYIRVDLDDGNVHIRDF